MNVLNWFTVGLTTEDFLVTVHNFLADKPCAGGTFVDSLGF